MIRKVVDNYRIIEWISGGNLWLFSTRDNIQMAYPHYTNTSEIPCGALYVCDGLGMRLLTANVIYSIALLCWVSHLQHCLFMMSFLTLSRPSGGLLSPLRIGSFGFFQIQIHEILSSEFWRFSLQNKSLLPSGAGPDDVANTPPVVLQLAPQWEDQWKRHGLWQTCFRYWPARNQTN